MNAFSFPTSLRWIYGLTFACLLGCSPHPTFVENRLFIKRLEIENNEPLGTDERGDVARTLAELFGTADEPVLSDQVSVVKLEKLQHAAGRVFSDENDRHFGLYRNNCIRCHGTTGDGRGPAARLLSPYPRDFRLGKFKFKSTPQGSKPNKEDIVRTLRHGIPGTSMPSFSLLRDEDIEALAEYVIYLSVRGETERELLTEVAQTLDYRRGDRLIDFELKDRAPEKFNDQLAKFQSAINDRYNKWNVQSAPDPKLPTEFPVIGASELTDDSARIALHESINRGQQLFRGNLASCSKCHGSDGTGIGAPQDYDDWTKDWTLAISVKPEDKVALKPLLRAGGLKPVPMYPRNLRLGIFRGGSSPEAIYSRIVHGIEGTSMPAAAVQPQVAEGLSQDQVWDLVNYVLSLSRSLPAAPKESDSASTVATILGAAP